MKRSYQLELLLPITYCGAWLNALGANSALTPGEDGVGRQFEVEGPAVWGGFGGGLKGADLSGVPVAEDGPLSPGMFAVGGGTIPVNFPLAVAPVVSFEGGLRVPSALGFDLVGPPPYFSSSCRVVLYLVASLSFATVASRCFCKALRRSCELDIRNS